MRENQKVELPTPEHVALIAKRDHDLAVEAARADATAVGPVGPAGPSTPEDNRSVIQKALDGARSK
jgi:hypothetical protein